MSCKELDREEVIERVSLSGLMLCGATWVVVLTENDAHRIPISIGTGVFLT
jgi:hypothetical protein